jgi:hypothetical protein
MKWKRSLAINRRKGIQMKRLVSLLLPVCALALLLGCATTPPAERKDFLFVPVHLGYFGGNVDVEDSAFNGETNTIENMIDSTTVAFYKSSDMDKYKKAACNTLYFITSKKEEIKRFNPNREDLLVMKTGYTEGYSSWFFILTSYSEYSYPNVYAKDIHFDINGKTGDYLEASFAIMAVNIGNKPIHKLSIVDVMPSYIELNGEIKYATDDLFIPLNVKLSPLQGMQHRIVRKDNKLIIIYEVLPEVGGIEPGSCVEIVVPIKLLKSTLMREENRVKE